MKPDEIEISKIIAAVLNKKIKRLTILYKKSNDKKISKEEDLQIWKEMITIAKDFGSFINHVHCSNPHLSQLLNSLLMPRWTKKIMDTMLVRDKNNMSVIDPDLDNFEDLICKNNEGEPIVH